MTQTITASADVATEKPVPYMRQLCKHFGHKIETSYDDTTGYIVFGDGRVDLEALEDSNTLRLTVSADSADSVERVQNVVGSHLERFGKRDELTVSWND
jgi:uncharacterized protein